MIFSSHFTFFSLQMPTTGRNKRGEAPVEMRLPGKGLPEVGMVWPGRGGGAKEGGAQGRQGGGRRPGRWGGASGEGEGVG